MIPLIAQHDVLMIAGADVRRIIRLLPASTQRSQRRLSVQPCLVLPALCGDLLQCREHARVTEERLASRWVQRKLCDCLGEILPNTTPQR